MKPHVLWPCSSFCLGILTFILRKHQLAQAKDPETLLFVPMATETIVLSVVMIVAHILLVVALGSPSRPLPNYKYTIYHPSIFFFAPILLSSVLMGLATLVGLIDIHTEYRNFKTMTAGADVPYSLPVFDVMQSFFALFVAYLMYEMGKNAYEGETLAHRWWSVIPAFMCCWLFTTQYRIYAISPNFQEKIYPTLGGLFLLHGMYQLAVAAYQTPRPVLLSFFGLSATIFCGVNLASNPSTFDGMLLTSLTLYLLTFTSAVIRNAYASRKEYVTPPVE